MSRPVTSLRDRPRRVPFIALTTIEPLVECGPGALGVLAVRGGRGPST
jgi:hypothetical protein